MKIWDSVYIYISFLFAHFQLSTTCVGTTANQLVGYALDGYPIYFSATNAAGTTLKSCWTSSSTSPTNISNFTYDTTGYTAGTCHLDKANGYTFADGTYGYVVVSNNYYTPYYYAGTTKASICGFTG